MTRTRQAPNALRIDLAHALGFPDYPASATAEPYLNYISNRCIGRRTMERYLKLVVHVVRHFPIEDAEESSIAVKSVQSLLDRLATSTNEHFSDTKAVIHVRRDDVEDTVMYVIGVCTLLLSSFIHLPFAGGARRVTLAYNIRSQALSTTPTCLPYEESVSGLIRGSGLLPATGH